MIGRRTAGVGITGRVGAAAGPPALSGLARQAVEESGAPGAVVGRRGPAGPEIGTCGLASVGGRPVRPEDRWHIGSLAKSMTATVVARLAEAGRIRWEDTVGEVLGPVIGAIRPWFAEASYADLLRHRAGLGCNLPLLEWVRLGWSEDRDLRADRLHCAAVMLARRPAGPRGQFRYSNAGYVVAGAMLEQALGQTWEALIGETLFAPLGLASAGFGPPSGDDPVTGHRRRLLGGLRAVPPSPGADNVPALGPAGTVHIAMGDMLTYLACHATEDPGFLGTASWALLHEPPPAGEPCAMGWARNPDGTLRHDGSNTLWYASMLIDRKRRRAAAVFMNACTGRQAQCALAARILARAIAD
ncbi:MAG: beta-lactamase family protein [Rhodobacteraceae bacterium]|nr:beta-lactamase family protein [Paracoccaceae bacterium]